MTDYNSDDEVMFLSNIPVGLIKENLKVQFSDPVEYRKKNYISKFLKMYKKSIKNIDYYEDEEKDDLELLTDDFWKFLQSLFHLTFNIDFPDFADRGFDEQAEIMMNTYLFFIGEIRKNFLNIVSNYINENKDNFTLDENKRDVTTVSMLNEISDESDVSILSNLSEVVNEALAEITDIEDFFDKCINKEDPSDHATEVMRYYDEFIIVGDFTDKYLSFVNEEFKSTLETKMRIKILGKYRKK